MRTLLVCVLLALTAPALAGQPPPPTPPQLSVDDVKAILTLLNRTPIQGSEAAAFLQLTQKLSAVVESPK